jgi:L-alanine-DL-glutamate epimerase-like enolase superfamily enzyme
MRSDAAATARSDARPLKIERIEASIFRVPLDTPVATSFGTMRDRPALLVKATDGDGAFGWGEVWCNWPVSAAEHRIRLVTEDLAELVLGGTFADARACFAFVSERIEVKALQAGEPGPYAQAIAGLDMAIWDLSARRAGKPLHTLLAPASTGRVPAYASGIDSRAAGCVIPESRESGYRDFKIKVGFDLDEDIRLTNEAARSLEAGERLAADANQGFGLDAALRFAAGVRNAELRWLEEPLRVDAPTESWRDLSERASMQLAGGENLIGRAAFEVAIRERHLKVIQPDAAKWGGVTGCFDVARATLDAGLTYCPHFLGSGIGLAASAHLLAAAGGEGLLEIDVNPNPLRSDIADAWPAIEEGMLRLSEKPGLGLEPEVARIARFRTAHVERVAD